MLSLDRHGFVFVDEPEIVNNTFRPSESKASLLLTLFKVGELEVEVVEDQRNREPSQHLGQGLAQADALAAKEWAEREGMAHTSIGTAEVLGLGIEAVGNELQRVLELSRVSLNELDANEDGIASFQEGLPELHIFRHLLTCRDLDRRLESQRLTIAHLGVLKIICHVVIKSVHEVITHRLQLGHHLSKQSMLQLRLHGEVVDQVGGADLDSLEAGE